MFILKCPRCGKLYSINETEENRKDGMLPPDVVCLNCGKSVPSLVPRIMRSLYDHMAQDECEGWQLYRVPEDATVEANISFH